MYEALAGTYGAPGAGFGQRAAGRDGCLGFALGLIWSRHGPRKQAPLAGGTSWLNGLGALAWAGV